MTDLPSFTRYAQDLAPPWARPGKAGAGFYGAVLADASDAIAEAAQQIAALPALRDDCPLDAIGEAQRNRGYSGGVVSPANPLLSFDPSARWAELLPFAREAFDRWGEVYTDAPTSPLTAGHGVNAWVSRGVFGGGAVKIFVSDAYSHASGNGGWQAETLLAPDTSDELWSDYRLVIDGEDDLLSTSVTTECSETTYCLDDTLCGVTWTAAGSARITALIDLAHDHMPAHYRMTGVVISNTTGFGDDVTISDALNATGSGGVVDITEGKGWRLI